jgi:HlyD family secretion protein
MFHTKTFWIILAALVLVTGGGIAVYAWVILPNQNQAPEQVITTAEVRRGDLTVFVSGSGTLSPASVDLAFPAAGVVDEVLVGMGDRVEEGDVLVRLETDELELGVAEAEIRARRAELDLADAVAPPTEAELADAWASLESARTALLVAQTTYSSTLNSDLDAAVRPAQIRFQVSVDRYWALETGGADGDRLQEAWRDWSQDEAAFNDAARRAELEELDARNHVDQALDRVREARERLEQIQDGLDDETVARAEVQAEQAALALDEARANLEAAELCAPSTGVVAALTVVPGERAGTSPVVTLVDLEDPLLLFWVEEADAGGVAVGNRTDVFFEALPDDEFSGEVVRVDPALVTVDGRLAVQSWARVDFGAYGGNLYGGLNADVDVISAEARDTLLVPVQALRELGEDSYAVFVARPDGGLEMRLVEVGLQDFVNAEILSGLEAGDVVSTGVAESTGTDAVQQEPGMPFGPGGMGPGGGILGGGGR